MSFLNPVNEPVLRFSSTDAGAPQINYNARAAGDVKAVLKACLVTGYGTTASAGWSAVNEVANVIEFVSPSAAMSDYRLGISDVSTSSTEWYYTEKDSRVNPTNRTPTKSFDGINATSDKNGWQLFATTRGLYFVELVYSVAAGDLSARLTFFGQSKVTLQDALGKNIGFFNIGHSAATDTHLFYNNAGKNTKISTFANLQMMSLFFSLNSSASFITNVDIVSPLWLSDYSAILGEQVGLLERRVASKSSVYGSSDAMLSNRPVFMFCLGYHSSGEAQYLNARPAAIRTDYWEY